jgi:hypothetical protein
VFFNGNPKYLPMTIYHLHIRKNLMEVTQKNRTLRILVLTPAVIPSASSDQSQIAQPMAGFHFENSANKLTHAIPFMRTRRIIKDMIQNLLAVPIRREAVIGEGAVLHLEVGGARRGSPI